VKLVNKTKKQAKKVQELQQTKPHCGHPESNYKKQWRNCLSNYGQNRQLPGCDIKECDTNIQNQETMKTVLERAAACTIP